MKSVGGGLSTSRWLLHCHIRSWILAIGFYCLSITSAEADHEGLLKRNTECLFSGPGTAYVGRVSTTRSGRPCQAWGSQTPHSHPYVDAMFYPDLTVAESGHSCRNPRGVRPGGVWCYTEDDQTEWEYCHVPACDCRVTKSGQSYGGTHTHTRTGMECQRWDSQEPHEHSYTSADRFPDDTLNNASNYCRNPDPGWFGGPWCFTTNNTTRWQLCEVPFCECKTDDLGVDYDGEVSTTVSGKGCQRWDSRTPHDHRYDNPASFPERNVSSSSNYCRNPDGDGPGGPWCYTTDPAVRWEYCAVPRCEAVTPLAPTRPPVIFTTPYDGAMVLQRIQPQALGQPIQSCKFDQMGTTYRGKQNTTISGLSCQRWDSQTPHPHPYNDHTSFPDLSLEETTNYCRNPNHRPLGPWCYTNSPDRQWEYCDVPLCDCKVSRRGETYVGTQNVTVSGKKCQAWEDQTPHAHDYDVTMFPDDSLRSAGVWCRNPDDSHPEGPWCLTLDNSTRWEYCTVPFCECVSVSGQYEGHVAGTVSGKTCQRWDRQTPHSHNYDKPELFPEGDVSGARNYCRNPDPAHGRPWCYTTDAETRWQYCDVTSCERPPPVTEAPGSTSPASVSYPECVRDGSPYRGTTSVTGSGRPCQSWMSQSPHAHQYNDPASFPDSSLTEAANYCRNPDHTEPLPWCYTTDLDTRWEYCHIPTCGCVKDDIGWDYTGVLSVTSRGLRCQRWDVQLPHPHHSTNHSLFPDSSVGEAANYCRNPGRSWLGGPWCYTTDQHVEWDYCQLPKCEVKQAPTTESVNECRTSRSGREYTGERGYTRSGLTCQAWSSQTPHQHPFKDATAFPDDNLEDASTYCRNPAGSERERGPWCYTTDSQVTWESCDIPSCGCKTNRHGQQYQGPVSRTVSGRACQRWDSESPHAHNFVSSTAFPEGSAGAAQAQCRNPDESETGGPWCFTTDPDVRWEYCNVPLCECLTSAAGTEYTGTASTTTTSFTCQLWVSQVPHPHNLTDVTLFPDATLEDASNYCRNPGGRRPGGPWCYVTNPAVEWDYCDVTPCDGATFVTNTSLPPLLWPTTRSLDPDSSQRNQECKDTTQGSEYRGKQNLTMLGTQCQRWDSQEPHSHRLTGDKFPDSTLGDAGNFCRNPDGSQPNGPWCFTVDPRIRWIYCEVPVCGTTDPTTTVTTLRPQFSGSKGCKTHRTGWSYQGPVNWTLTGRTCQRWDSQHPHTHSLTKASSFVDDSLEGAGNGCRNPDEWRPEGPWCFTTDPAVRWEYCSVPFCECRSTVAGREYGGRISTTVTGLTCQRWDSQAPHAHRHFSSDDFPDKSVAESENFCRNPDTRENGGPWCYTTDSATRWQYCPIPLCDEEKTPMVTPTDAYVGDGPKNKVSGGGGGGLSAGAIAAIVLGVLLVLLIAGVLVLIYWQRDKVVRSVKARSIYTSDPAVTHYSNSAFTGGGGGGPEVMYLPKPEDPPVTQAAIDRMRPSETVQIEMNRTPGQNGVRK